MTAYTRRAFIGLAGLAAAPLFATACSADDLRPGARLQARPRAVAQGGVATPEPQPLGLASGRDGLFHVPASAAAGAAPLLLYLHGGTHSSAESRALVPYAERAGVILVAPDSRGPTWGLVHGDEPADLAFIDRALGQVFAGWAVDERRIAIAGFSDGATAALSWGLVNGALFAGIAAFSPGFVHVAAPPEGRPRVFIAHGRSDPVFPIDRCGRRIATTLRSAGYAVDFREFDGGHEIEPQLARDGLAAALG